MAADAKPFRVGISGSYGGLNVGDEAILQSIVKQLRDSLPVEIVVFSRDAKDAVARHAVDRAVPVRDLSRDEVRPEVRSLDLLILGGGRILYDAEAALYLREVELAQEYEVPVLVYAVSAGPLNDTNVQALVRQSLDGAAAVTVRDRRARTLLPDRHSQPEGTRHDPAAIAARRGLRHSPPLPPPARRRARARGRPLHLRHA
jgi:polysaccharide pyruvyl transferase WcaK-like protein